MNWAGFAFKCAQTDFKLGSDIMNITANYLTSLTKESSLKAQARNQRAEADNLLALAEWHEKQSGEIQEAGRLSREQRLLKLGQERGQMTAGAAGSGIDVSSRIVRKAIGDTVKSAYNDVMVMAKNEQVQVQSEINESASSRANAVWARDAAEWTEFAARLERSNRKWGVVSGALGAAGNWAGGMAGAGSALFGG